MVAFSLFTHSFNTDDNDADDSPQRFGVSYYLLTMSWIIAFLSAAVYTAFSGPARVRGEGEDDVIFPPTADDPFKGYGTYSSRL